MSDLLERITVNPKQCGDRPCIRGMRTVVKIEVIGYKEKNQLFIHGEEYEL